MMATNFATATYNEIVDMQTINGKTTIIGIHTPQGERVRSYLRGFFDQFRFFRYEGISSMVGVNAAQLPVDPLGLTGVTGTTDLMDPRDNLNPILFHGCHGESLGPILNTIYTSRERTYAGSGLVENGLVDNLVNNNVSDSLLGTDVENYLQYSAYYSALTDKTWKKFGIQSGVRLKGLHPRVWKMARNSPLLPLDVPADINQANAGLLKYSAENNGQNADLYSAWGVSSPSSPLSQGRNVEDYGTDDENPIVSKAYDQYLTNGTARLGWMPTSQNARDGSVVATMLPKLYMGILVLPPSYNVEQFLRFRITHRISFRGFTTSLGNMSRDSQDVSQPAARPAYFNWIDYTTTNSKGAVGELSPISYGETLDIIGGESKLISDGVM